MLLKNFFAPKKLKQTFSSFGLGMGKHFVLDIEVIVFTITLLGNERSKTQNDTHAIKTVKVKGIEDSHKEILY